MALDGSVNLSVRALSDQGHSPDAACTITLGNGEQLLLVVLACYIM